MSRFTGGVAAVALLAGLGAAAAQQSTEGRAPPADQIQPVLIDGRLTAPGTPIDGQTVPSKYSERNAALDKLPIMATPLPLTEEQKQRIYQSVNETKATAGNVAVKPAEVLPDGVEMHPLPQQIADEIPAVRGLKYAKVEGKVLLVQPPNRIVVGEIGK